MGPLRLLLLYVAADVSAQKVNIFDVQDTNKNLPLAPSSYPEELQGMMWMDQAGFYSGAPIPGGGEPDGAFSFGDENNMYQPDTRQIVVDCYGPAWQWFNNPRGYASLSGAYAIGFAYRFEYDADMSGAQIIQTLTVFGETVDYPSIMKFSMVKQTPGPECASLPRNSTPEERQKCAAFVRISTFLGFELPNYYVFRVVDKNGAKIEPYYQAMVDRVLSPTAEHSPDPDAAAAAAAGIILSDAVTVNSTLTGVAALHGTINPSNPSNPATCAAAKKDLGVEDCTAKAVAAKIVCQGGLLPASICPFVIEHLDTFEKIGETLAPMTKDIMQFVGKITDAVKEAKAALSTVAQKLEGF